MAQQRVSVPEAKRLYVPTAQASSFLLNNWNKYQENYHPNYAFDDVPETAWVEGVEGEGLAEKLTWRVSSLASALQVRLRIRNGYQKSKKLFEANGAPHKIQITLLQEDRKPVVEKAFELKQVMGWQEVTIDVPETHGFASIELKVLSVYPGKTYQDTCISDIQTFVVSNVPYNEKVELGKKAELRNWVKQRLKDAQYFANLPVEYPFASSVFKLVEKKSAGEDDLFCDQDGAVRPSGQPKFVPFNLQFQANQFDSKFGKIFSEDDLKFIREAFVVAKEIRKDKPWYQETLSVTARSTKAPDMPGANPYGLGEVLQVLAARTQADQLSFFEAKAATSNVFKPNAADEQTVRVQSNYKVKRDAAANSPQYLYFWRKDVGVERSVWQKESHFLLAYGPDKRLRNILTWSTSSSPQAYEPNLEKTVSKPLDEASLFLPTQLSVIELGYSKGSKVASISVKEASYSDFDCGSNSYSFDRYESDSSPIVSRK